MSPFFAAFALVLAAAAPPQTPAPHPASASAEDLRRVQALYEAKKYDEAIAILEAALRKSPNDPDLLFDLGLALRDKGEPDRARQAFEKELALRPDDAEAHLALARCYEALGNRVPAVLAELRFLSLAPSSERTRDVVDSMQKLMSGGVGKDRHDPEKFVLPEKAKGPENADGIKEDPEVLMAFIAAAAKYRGEDEKPFSEAEQLVREMKSFTGFLSATGGVTEPFAAKTYLPFASELNAKGFVEPLGYAVAAASGKSGGKDWVALPENATKVAAMREWAKSWRAK
jgi:tetratricopeptide (TPR) repeat protein